MRHFLFIIFCLLLMLAPLFFGMVHHLFQALFAVMFLGLVVAYGLERAVRGDGPAVSLRRIAPETVGFLLVLGWMVLQMLGLTPLSWHHPMWQEAGAVLGVAVDGSISLAPGEGFAGLMRWLMYAAVFWLALQWGQDRHRARQIFLVLMVAAVLYAIYGLVARIGGLNMVLWVERHQDSVTGTFINRNNFATYLGLATVVTVGFYLHLLLRALHTWRQGRDRWHHITQEGMVKAAPQLACLLVLLTALFMSNSRSGVTSTLMALLVLVMFMVSLQRVAGLWYKLLLSSLLVLVLGVFFVSGDTWWNRLSATDLKREQRIQVYEETRNAIAHAPYLGYGVGAYEQTFPMFADHRTSNFDKAHNDWLETIYELGWPAALLWFAVLATLAGRCLLGTFQRHRDNIYPAAGFTAALLVGLHAMTDFSLQIPAVAITFAAILGVGVAQSRSSRN